MVISFDPIKKIDTGVIQAFGDGSGNVLCIAVACVMLSSINVLSGARRLEVRQNKNYGTDPAYQAYVKSVPILLPFIPLYSVEKYKFLGA